ncbi:MAG: hypothetical protein MJE66_03990 [Proteobacteria bacterium]|nr:hypothetical protein [Pseudomonadota bacterium]
MRMRALVLAGVAGLLLGTDCGGGGPRVSIWLAPFELALAPGDVAGVQVFMRTNGTPLQAYELEVNVDPALLTTLQVLPHADFDDNGALLVDPVFGVGTGSTSRIVDVRRGAAASGEFRIATLVVAAQGPGSGVVRLRAGAATPTGADFRVDALDAAVTVAAP